MDEKTQAIINTLLTTNEPAGLDSFDLATRFEALGKYMVQLGCAFPDSPTKHNMHGHTFFSFNCLGWSPTHYALASKLLGFRYTGMVDFDVLDGVDEFRYACKLLGVQGVCGMETRVYIPEMADVEINSPGEPGIAYHLGVGFQSGKVPACAEQFAKDLRERSRVRTRTVMERVNAAVPEVAVDYDKELSALTPAGNPTERHLCHAYLLKGNEVFGSKEKAMPYWAKVLKMDDAKTAKAAASDVALEANIRSALMKSGGPGYIKPDASSFPSLEDMNAFTKACGGIPCLAWLNGMSGGEADAVKLLEFHASKGAEAITIIPDRNWNVGDAEKSAKLVAKLDEVVKAAAKIGMPILAGTELNTPGQKLVDDFNKDPLAAYLDDFLLGAEKVCRRFA